jgi:ribose-phosphate pyrophosphokinase
MNRGNIALFALDASRDFGDKVSTHLGIPLSPHEELDFDDGEHKVRPLCSVRNQDVFVMQSLYSGPHDSVNDKLCRLLFFLGALRDASAERVTAVVPYLCYAREDRKTKARDPVITRYVACLLEAVGVDRVLTLDVHNLAAFQNAARCPTDHLEAQQLFIDYFVPRMQTEEVVVVSPDAGGLKRAEAFRQALSQALHRPIDRAFKEKYRTEGVVSGDAFFGDVAHKVAIIIDDMISTGTTLARAVTACHERGAKRIYAAASHGIFVGHANEVLAHPALDEVVVTDTIPPFRLAPEVIQAKLVVLDAAALFAKAITCIHTGGSIADLLNPGVA